MFARTVPGNEVPDDDQKIDECERDEDNSSTKDVPGKSKDDKKSKLVINSNGLSGSCLGICR